MSLLKTNEIQNYNGSSLTLTASTVSTSAQLNTGGNISVTGSLNVSDDSTTRTNLGLGSMATQNANAVAITGGTINTVQPATGQSLTIKDEDGNTAITIGTDNTAAGYLSLNFGSYHGGSGTQTGNTLSDYETGSWAPTLSNVTLGNASIGQNKYEKIGTLVYLSVNITFGSTTSFHGGDIRISSLPFTPSASGHGSAYLLNYGTAAYLLPAAIPTSTSLDISIASTTTAQGRDITNTAPFTWGVNDRINLSLTYTTS